MRRKPIQILGWFWPKGGYSTIGTECFATSVGVGVDASLFLEQAHLFVLGGADDAVSRLQAIRRFFRPIPMQYRKTPVGLVMPLKPPT